MKKMIALLVVMLAVAAFARYQVFRLHEMEISPDFYERKMQLDDFFIPEDRLPAGHRLAASLPGTRDNPSELAPSELPGLSGRMPPIPDPELAIVALATAYTDGRGDPVLLLALEYPADVEPPDPLPKNFSRDGQFLLTFVTSNPLVRETYSNALDGQLDKLRTETRKLKKLSTIGNVILKLFMDILVGGFAFLLALFLVKYFLIVRATEG